MKDDHNFHLNFDVLLLAVFENFRNNSLENYGLCSSLYFSASALSWDGMLTMIKIEFEHISDVEMHVCFEKGTSFLHFQEV